MDFLTGLVSTGITPSEPPRGRMLTAVYVTLLNGSAIRFDADSVIVTGTGASLRYTEVATYLADPEHFIRHRTKVYEGGEEGTNEWEEEKTFWGWDTVYARSVGTVCEVTSEEAT